MGELERAEMEAEMTATNSLPEMTAAELAPVEEILGYRFNNRSLASEALTHSSINPRCSYDQLEFVGDTVLSLLVARKFYTVYPHLPVGPLTRLRAINVDKERLARIAVNHGLHPYLRQNSSTLDQKIQEFIESTPKYPVHSNGLLYTPKALADIVKSLLGAVFLDSDSLETAWKVFRRLAEPLIDKDTVGLHPVTELHELCQKTGRQLRFEDTWEENKTVKVFIDKKVVGSTTYGRKKDIATNRAAKDALDNLKKELAQHDLTPLSIAGYCNRMDDLLDVMTEMKKILKEVKNQISKQLKRQEETERKLTACQHEDPIFNADEIDTREGWPKSIKRNSTGVRTPSEDSDTKDKGPEVDLTTTIGQWMERNFTDRPKK